MRSYLFVPGDSPRKMEKALGSGADALILDLEDSVAPARKEEARALTGDFVRANRGRPGVPSLIVRVNALDTGLTGADVSAAAAAGPDAVLLPKASGGDDIGHIATLLSVTEAEAGLADGSIRIHALVTETAAGCLSGLSFANRSRRLAALAWGAEDLAADIGASSNKDETGRYTDVFRFARTVTVLAAAHAGVDAIDTVFTAFADAEGLAAECRAAVRDGFSGKMAIHPAQVPVINAAFTPAPEDVERAQRIVSLFSEAGPQAGVLSLDGKMIDRPHLRQAERILKRAAIV